MLSRAILYMECRIGRDITGGHKPVSCFKRWLKFINFRHDWILCVLMCLFNQLGVYERTNREHS